VKGNALQIANEARLHFIGKLSDNLIEQARLFRARDDDSRPNQRKFGNDIRHAFQTRFTSA
jgi:hypothetical protein